MTGDKGHDNRDRCFFCLHPHLPNSNTTSSLTKQLSFLFRHLNLNVTKRLSSNFEASLCEACMGIMSDFFNLYQQLELDRMCINYIIGQINDVINNRAGASNQNQEQEKTDLFGRMRTNLIDKCNQHLKKVTPRLTLTRVDLNTDRNDGESLEMETSIKVDEELMNPPETENYDRDGYGDNDDDDCDIDIAQCEPLEDLHAEDESQDDDSKIQCTESVSDAEKVQIVPGVQDRKAAGDGEIDHRLIFIFKGKKTLEGEIKKFGSKAVFDRGSNTVCRICNQRFANRVLKVSHERMHRLKKKFQCNVNGCSYFYFGYSTYELERHKSSRACPKLPKNLSFICSLCGKVFSSKQAKERHEMKGGAPGVCLAKRKGKLTGKGCSVKVIDLMSAAREVGDDVK